MQFSLKPGKFQGKLIEDESRKNVAMLQEILMISSPQMWYATILFAIKIQRFSELCENWRVLSHQILRDRTDRQETTLRMMKP